MDLKLNIYFLLILYYNFFIYMGGIVATIGSNSLDRVTQVIELPSKKAVKVLASTATATMVAKLAATYFGLAPFLGKAGSIVFASTCAFGGLALPWLSLVCALGALVSYAVSCLARRSNSQSIEGRLARLEMKGKELTKADLVQVVFPEIFKVFTDSHDFFNLGKNRVFCSKVKKQWKITLLNCLTEFVETYEEKRRLEKTDLGEDDLYNMAKDVIEKCVNQDFKTQVINEEILKCQLLVAFIVIDDINIKFKNSIFISIENSKKLGVNPFLVGSLQARLSAIRAKACECLRHFKKQNRLIGLSHRS